MEPCPNANHFHSSFPQSRQHTGKTCVLQRSRRGQRFPRWDTTHLHKHRKTLLTMSLGCSEKKLFVSPERSKDDQTEKSSCLLSLKMICKQKLNVDELSLMKLSILSQKKIVTKKIKPSYSFNNGESSQAAKHCSKSLPCFHVACRRQLRIKHHEGACSKLLWVNTHTVDSVVCRERVLWLDERRRAWSGEIIEYKCDFFRKRKSVFIDCFLILSVWCWVWLFF